MKLYAVLTIALLTSGAFGQDKPKSIGEIEFFGYAGIALDEVRAALPLLQDLIHHKGYANASLLKAIRRHETAAQDPELERVIQ
jgi:hypothetical protein